MLRVTTIYAATAGSAAAYYTKYLADSPGEIPGVWLGRQAAGLGLTGDVSGEDLLAVLEGRDPTSGTLLGKALVDTPGKGGKVQRAVAGFDATFSAPKSLSVMWALTGDDRLLEAHDTAVRAALAWASLSEFSSLDGAFAQFCLDAAEELRPRPFDQGTEVRQPLRADGVGCLDAPAGGVSGSPPGRVR